MIISFENKCDGLAELLEKLDFEDRDFALSHFLYSGILSYLTFQFRQINNEMEDYNEKVRIS